MKLVIQYCNDKELINKDIDTSYNLNLPFVIEYFSLKFPQSKNLIYKYKIDKKNKNTHNNFHAGQNLKSRCLVSILLQ